MSVELYILQVTPDSTLLRRCVVAGISSPSVLLSMDGGKDRSWIDFLFRRQSSKHSLPGQSICHCCLRCNSTPRGMDLSHIHLPMALPHLLLMNSAWAWCSDQCARKRALLDAAPQPVVSRAVVSEVSAHLLQYFGLIFRET